MERTRIGKEVKEIVADQVGRYREGIQADDIKEDSHIENDFGCDSLDLVEICMEVEKEFNISIADDEAERIQLVKDIVDLVEHKLRTDYHG